MLLLNQAIKSCFIFSPHLTIYISGKTGNPEIAYFYLNSTCCFANIHTKHIKISWYDETVIRKAMVNADFGISLGGRVINTIRYADDKAAVANSQKRAATTLDNLNKVTQKFGMKVNV